MAMSSSIDPDGPIPVYRQLAALLRAQIESGELPPGRAIPAEARLKDMYGVGRDTVRRALEVLRTEGIVITVWAKGTFPTDPADRDRAQAHDDENSRPTSPP